MITERDVLRAIVSALRWAWWAWVASRWSGGGPRHPSYLHAKWEAWVARADTFTLLGLTR